MKTLFMVLIFYANTVYAQPTGTKDVFKLKGDVHRIIEYHYDSNYKKDGTGFYERDTTWYKADRITERRTRNTQGGELRTISNYNEKELVVEETNYYSNTQQTKNIYIYDNNNKLIADTNIGIIPKFKTVNIYSWPYDTVMSVTSLQFDENDHLINNDDNDRSIDNKDGIITVESNTTTTVSDTIVMSNFFKPASTEINDTNKSLMPISDSVTIDPSSYKYDSKGNLVEVKCSAGETFTWKYEQYDKKGNWQLMKSCYQNGKIYQVIKREIVYY